MESPMLKTCKFRYPDKEYPSSLGQKWTDEEEILLLEEIDKNIDIAVIAQSHNRSTGGINARRKKIAYQMHIRNHSLEEIKIKTKLHEDQIKETINNYNNNPKKSKPIKEIEGTFSIESEIHKMQNEIKDLKKIMKELVEMIKAIYDFEDA